MKKNYVTGVYGCTMLVRGRPNVRITQSYFKNKILTTSHFLKQKLSELRRIIKTKLA